MPMKKKGNRAWKYGSNTLISGLLFAGILVLLAATAERHPWRLDLTESGIFTLSEQTRNILKAIDEPVIIKAFYPTATSEESRARDLLESYGFHNRKLSYELIDPAREPETARRYEIRSYGTLVIEGFNRKETIQSADEQALTNAILKLSRETEKKIYFLTGHGEHSLSGFDKDGYSSVRSALQKENYTVEELSLLQKAEVPEDAAVVVVAGPRKPLFKEELASLEAYYEDGGRLIVLVDPFDDGGLRDFLKGYGVDLNDDVIIDKLSRIFGASYLMPVVTEYGFNKIVENFSLATFYPEARSVRPAETLPEGAHVEILASTSPNAWAETDLELLKQGQASFDEKADRPGPVPLAVFAEIESKRAQAVASSQSSEAAHEADPEGDKRGEAKKGYMLVVGDSDFVNNTDFGLSGNGDLFLNMVNYLAEEENLITIAPRQQEGQPILLTRSQAQLVFWTVLFIVPFSTVLIGLAVYRVRRSQR